MRDERQPQVVVTGGAKWIGNAIVGKFAALGGGTEQGSEAALAGQSPLGRLLEPEAVADAVVFLASPAAHAINGQAVVTDGGGIQA